MTGKRVKVNVFDVNEDLDEDFEWVEVLETQNIKRKIEIEDAAESVQEDTAEAEDNQKGDYIISNRRRHIRPALNRISRIIDENKESLKENFDEDKYRESLDKVLDRQRDRVDRISDFSKDIADEIFLSSDSFINRIKYERTKDEGREIKIEKKE